MLFVRPPRDTPLNEWQRGAEGQVRNEWPYDVALCGERQMARRDGTSGDPATAQGHGASIEARLPW
jgi:hypothetical protein